MLFESVKRLVEHLNKREVKFLLVGGLAVSAHGHIRATHDIDLAVSLDPAEAGKLIHALGELGYSPLAPVPFSDFGSEEKRKLWREQKGMLAFSVITTQFADGIPVDLLMELPFDFGEAYSRAVVLELWPEVQVRVVSLEDLIHMKELAGRPHDLQDVDALRRIRAEGNSDEAGSSR